MKKTIEKSNFGKFERSELSNKLKRLILAGVGETKSTYGAHKGQTDYPGATKYGPKSLPDTKWSGGDISLY